MDVSNAEKIFCSDRTLGTLQMLLRDQEHPLLKELANVRSETRDQCVKCLDVLVWFIQTVQRIVMPLTVLNPRQAARLKQPLYEAVTKGNIDRIFSDMKVALSELRPSTNARKSLPRPTWTGLHVTVYGTEEVARKLLHAGFEFVLPGKMSSDPIERIFSAFKYGSGKVTVGKVKEEVARMETLQHLTGTTNVSRMGRQKRKIPV
ncbi:uncharacterized protein LOC129588435 [Paramacrobiotus metropolitanus]|uniref:uncharacterized protein LOC129588435 n=1 Tax=Paramacrobiotus metropolitanus TaxID=2943436 RepID=UPI002445C9EC|nr:uncharacterized protein LOC129588435 [Paramacrobiotus metropolitanus]